MSLIDAFSKEDRVPVTFTDFFNLVKQAAQYENIMNAVKCDVPHAYIREMTTGKKEERTTEAIANISMEIKTEELEEAIQKAMEEVFGKSIPDPAPPRLLSLDPKENKSEQTPDEEAIPDETPPINGEERR